MYIKTDNKNKGRDTEQIQNEKDENNQDIDIVSGLNPIAIASNAETDHETSTTSTNDETQFTFSSWMDLSHFKKLVDNFDPNEQEYVLSKHAKELIKAMYQYHKHMLGDPKGQQIVDELIIYCFDKYIANGLDGMLHEFYRMMFRKAASATADIFNGLRSRTDRERFEGKLKESLKRNLATFASKQKQDEYVHPYN